MYYETRLLSDERDSLMDFRRGHTKACLNSHDSKAVPQLVKDERQRQQGNAFQAGTVAYILSHWAVKFGFLKKLQTVNEMRQFEIANL